jgi:hypothetical protein
MTPLAGFVAAIIAGWIVRDPRRTVAAVVIPFLIVLTMQTWGIAAGDGVSPPSTVTPISGAISYYVFQAVFLGFALGIAAELATLRRARKPASDRAGAGRRMALAAALLAGLAVAFDAVWLLVSAPVRHHSASGAPPLQGLAGIGLCVVAFAVLSALTIRERRSAARAKLASTGPSAVMAGERG